MMEHTGGGKKIENAMGKHEKLSEEDYIKKHGNMPKEYAPADKF